MLRNMFSQHNVLDEYCGLCVIKIGENVTIYTTCPHQRKLLWCGDGSFNQMSLTLKMSTRASCLNGTTTIVKFTGSSCLLTQHLNQKIIRQKLSWLLRPLFCTVALLRWDSIITYQWRCSLILNYILFKTMIWAAAFLYLDSSKSNIVIMQKPLNWFHWKSID